MVKAWNVELLRKQARASWIPGWDKVAAMAGKEKTLPGGRKPRLFRAISTCVRMRNRTLYFEFVLGAALLEVSG